MTWNYYNITKEEEMIDYLTDLIKEVEGTPSLDNRTKDTILEVLEKIIEEEKKYR